MVRPFARLVLIITLVFGLSGCVGHRRSGQRLKSGLARLVVTVLVELIMRASHAAERGRSHDASARGHPESTTTPTRPKALPVDPVSHPVVSVVHPIAAPMQSPETAPSRFDALAARRALEEVDLQSCRKLGLPRGYVRVGAVFGRTGNVETVSLEEPHELPEEAHTCVIAQVREVTVPSLTQGGGALTVGATWFVP